MAKERQTKWRSVCFKRILCGNASNIATVSSRSGMNTKVTSDCDGTDARLLPQPPKATKEKELEINSDDEEHDDPNSLRIRPEPPSLPRKYNGQDHVISALHSSTYTSTLRSQEESKKPCTSESSTPSTSNELSPSNGRDNASDKKSPPSQQEKKLDESQLQEHKRMLYRRQQARILILLHAKKCTYDQNGNCPIAEDCAPMKILWRHIAKCTKADCPVPQCVSSRYIISHYHACIDAQCPVCGPIRPTPSTPSTPSPASLRGNQISFGYPQSTISAMTLETMETLFGHE